MPVFGPPDPPPPAPELIPGVRAAILQCPTCDGTVTIAGHSMHRKAFCLYDLSSLFNGTERRGSNRIRPGYAGAKAYRRRRDATQHSLPIHVSGAYDVNNAVAAVSFDRTLEENLTWLQANLVEDPGGNGTRTLVWTLPSGRTITAAVQVLRLRGQRRPGRLFTGVLDIEDPGALLHL